MLFRAVSLCTLLVVAFTCAGGADAQERGDKGVRSSPPDVRGWLMRIHEAAKRQNFQGTFVVSGGGHVASARMAHFSEGANQFERIESLDGQPRSVYRYNDTVHTLWPQSRVAVVEQRDLLTSFPALLQAGADGIADWYDVHPQPPDRVAGLEANVLLVKPKDGYRYGYRLWSERASGLLLRAEVLGERGDVLETSAFSDIVIGVLSQPDSVVQPMKKLDGYRVLRPAMQPAALEAEGWLMREVAPGFRQVSSVSRDFDASVVRDAVPASRRVLQAIYADGMTYVSVFIEPYHEARHARPLSATVGATQTMALRHGDWWVTLVGDVPAATLRIFARGLERKK